MEKNQFVHLANVDEISTGKMKYVKTNGNEILVANVDGKFHVLCDRCARMNAPLSIGSWLLQKTSG
jgi:nitrite reductase/ring-hydroxylating ferredoxin subunit